MRNPCQTCERADLDKSECALDCKVRVEYCKHLGIPVGDGMAGRRAGKSAVMEALADNFMRRNPGAKVAKCSIVNGKEHVQVIEARGELHKGADGIYRSKPPKEPKPPFDWHAPRGMRSKGGRLEQATAYIKEGRGNRETCRLTGMSKNTAAKLRKILELENGGPFFCGCGRPAVHQGSCLWVIERRLRENRKLELEVEDMTK